MASTGLIRANSGAVYTVASLRRTIILQLATVQSEIRRYRDLIDALQDSLVFETSRLPLATSADFSFAAWKTAFDEISAELDKLNAFQEIRTEMEKFVDFLKKKLDSLTD